MYSRTTSSRQRRSRTSGDSGLGAAIQQRHGAVDIAQRDIVSKARPRMFGGAGEIFAGVRAVVSQIELLGGGCQEVVGARALESGQPGGHPRVERPPVRLSNVP